MKKIFFLLCIFAAVTAYADCKFTLVNDTDDFVWISPTNLGEGPLQWSEQKEKDAGLSYERDRLDPQPNRAMGQTTSKNSVQVTLQKNKPLYVYVEKRAVHGPKKVGMMGAWLQQELIKIADLGMWTDAATCPQNYTVKISDILQHRAFVTVPAVRIKVPESQSMWQVK